MVAPQQRQAVAVEVLSVVVIPTPAKQIAAVYRVDTLAAHIKLAEHCHIVSPGLILLHILRHPTVCQTFRLVTMATAQATMHPPIRPAI